MGQIDMCMGHGSDVIFIAANALLPFWDRVQDMTTIPAWHGKENTILLSEFDIFAIHLCNHRTATLAPEIQGVDLPLAFPDTLTCMLGDITQLQELAMKTTIISTNLTIQGELQCFYIY